MRTHRHNCADFDTYLDPTPQVCNSKISQSSKKLVIEQKNHHPDIIQVNKMFLGHSFRLVSKKLSQTKCFVGNEIHQFFGLVAQKLNQN